MISIILEPAENGIIKTITDDNYGGGEVSSTSVSVFEESKLDKFNHVKRLFFEICEDLNINTGNKFDRSVLVIDTAWGSHYSATNEEIDDRINNLKSEIELLESCKS